MMCGMPELAPGYFEDAPPAPLRSLVACTWLAVSPADGPVDDTPVLPDGCIDIIWDGASLFVAGPDTGPAPVERAAAGFFVGLRFQPGVAPAFLGLPASELLDRRVPLLDLWGRPATELAGRLAAVTAADAPDVLAAELASALAEPPAVDAVVREAIRLVEGGTTVRDAAAAVDVSDRQLQRRFNAAVGYGAKTFARIARFRRFLQLAERARPGTAPLAGMAAEAGYADQAHLSRECVALGGLPPLALLASRGVRFVQDGAPTPA